IKCAKPQSAEKCPYGWWSISDSTDDGYNYGRVLMELCLREEV
ncbi:hypothetical protein LCGC14_2540830, partial [marine sediment metagenome]